MNETIKGMAKFAKEHGITYGQLQLMLDKGEITYEHIGVKKTDKVKHEQNLVLAEWGQECNICGKLFIRDDKREKYCCDDCRNVAKLKYAQDSYHKLKRKAIIKIN